MSRHPLCLFLEWFEHTIKLFFIITVFFYPIFAESDTASDGEVSNLSLGALFNLSSVSSKVEMLVQDAPGIISVYSKNEASQSGYFTIADLARITPGYSVNTRFAELGLETRGQGTDGWNNNKHLLIIDGIPIRHVRANRALIEENMPIHYAKRVELLKGPASAVYGVGALLGVINVVSDEPEEGVTGGMKVFTRLREDRDKDYPLSGAYGHLSGKTDVGISRAAVSYYNRHASNTPIGGEVKRPYQDDNKSIFLKASHDFTSKYLKGFGLGFLYSQKEGGIGEYWAPETSPMNNVLWTTAVPYFKYERDLGEKFSIKSYLSFTQSVEEGFYTSDPYNTASAQNNGEWHDELRAIDGLIEGRVQFNDDRLIMVGFNYFQNWGLGSNEGTYAWDFGKSSSDSTYVFTDNVAFAKEKEKSRTYSAFAQYSDRFNLLSGLLVTAGGRLDIGTYKEDTYAQFSPRIGIVQKFTEMLNLKLLYGTALRAPGQKEFNLNDETKLRIAEEEAAGGIVTNKASISDLKAENVQSFDYGLTINNYRIASSISGFYNFTNDPIQPITAGTLEDGTDLNAWKNGNGKLRAFGVEADFKCLINEYLNAFTNYAWARSLDQDDNPFPSVPTHRWNLGANFSIGENFPFSLTVINKFIGGFKTSDDKKDLDPVNTLDVYSSVGFGKSFKINLQVKNIIDDLISDDIVIPSDAGNTLVPQPEREICLGLSVDF